MDTSLYIHTTALSEDSNLLGATVELLASIGEAAKARDPTATLALLEDYLLPRLTPAIKQEIATSAKLHLTFRVIFAFW